MINRYEHINSFDRDRWFKSLGEALVILLNSDRKSLGIASVGAFVLPFVKLNQLEIFYGNNHFPAGYVAWGYLTTEALVRISQNPTKILEIDDLNAGDKLVIFDVVSTLRDINPIIRKIRSLAKGHCDGVYGIKLNKATGTLRVKNYRHSQAR